MKRGGKRGFSLLELMVVIAIIVLMSGMAVPYATGFISTQRLREVAWQMVQDLRLAKADAVLYQQDLNVYINYNNSLVETEENTNNNNRSYFFETFQWGVDQVVQAENKHYLPTDVTTGHFLERTFKYNIVIEAITGGAGSSISLGGKNYFVLCFRAGAGNTFRGEADSIAAMEDRGNSAASIVNNNGLLIKLKDTSTNKVYYVGVKGMGKVSMGSGPSS
jgi:prepilin-type N-terminal cleavage/methylation domain-containing protein